MILSVNEIRRTLIDHKYVADTDKFDVDNIAKVVGIGKMFVDLNRIFVNNAGEVVGIKMSGDYT